MAKTEHGWRIVSAPRPIFRVPETNVPHSVYTMKVEMKADVIHVDHNKGTVVIVKIGHLTVASGKLGGKWSEGQALAEFKKNPKRFKLSVEESVLRSFGVAV